jgi:peptidoglycan/xylan/chitin deacetylase (PgdA/CDA1 family)
VLLSFNQEKTYAQKLISANSESTSIGSIMVARWADDRTSAFSFSFDDGLLSQYENALVILSQFGFKGTFYVLPDFLTEDFPTIWRYGIWPQFQEIALEGHEVGSHTLTHPYLTNLDVGDTTTEGSVLYELYQSKKKIEQKIPFVKCITLAYPYSDRDSDIDSLTSLFYEASRSEGIEPNSFSLGFWNYYDLNSVPVRFNEPRITMNDDFDELLDFQNWTQGSIDNGQWGIMMVHEVVPFSELGDLVSQGLYEPMSNEWFTSYCEWINAKSQSKNVWIETVGNVMRYMKERDNYDYQLISASDNMIEINLTDSLNDVIYNFPLCAYIKVPLEWNKVLSEQDNRFDTLSVIQTDSGKVVLANIIPDKGMTKLTPLNITSVENELALVDEYELFQNYPNPFNPSTKIKYTIPTSLLNPSPYQGEGNRERSVTLKVYDILGNEVATLVNKEQPAGTYEVEFNSEHESLRAIASGVYFYQLRAGTFVETKKMSLLK